MKQLTIAFFLITALIPEKGLGSNKDSVSRPSEVIISSKNFTGSSVEGIYIRKVFKEKWLRVGFDYSHYQSSYNPQPQIGFFTRDGRSSASILLGIDRHRMFESLEVITGVNFRFGHFLRYDFQDDPTIPEADRRDSKTDFNYGIGAVYGIYYNFSENFSLGSTVNPSLRMYYANRDDYKTLSVHFDLMDIYLLSLRYKF